MSTVRPSQLDDQLDGDSAPFVLDIRPTNHYEVDAIEGSYNLPVYTALQEGDVDALLRRLDEIPADREIVVVCKMGVVAKQATQLLDKEGYSAATLLGGMNGWAGYHNDTLVYKLRSLLWRFR